MDDGVGGADGRGLRVGGADAEGRLSAAYGYEVVVGGGVGVRCEGPEMLAVVVAPGAGPFAEEVELVAGVEEAVAIMVDHLAAHLLDVGGGGGAVVEGEHIAAGAEDGNAVCADAAQGRDVGGGDAVHTLFLHRQAPPTAAAHHRLAADGAPPGTQGGKQQEEGVYLALHEKGFMFCTARNVFISFLLSSGGNKKNCGALQRA